ncbi:MAG: methyl-accepting chemotaxis protein, partial [Acidovorax sp.]|uniref:methyl-accepting chemotaxis protein n=1 Tax=Acidovorax sp. TaxID=1872122 RepID=UPI002625698E
VQAAVDRRAIAARNLVLATKPSEREVEKIAVTKAHEDVQSLLARLKKSASAAGVSADERKQIDDIEKTEQAYGPVALRIVDLALRDQREEAITRINDECRPLLSALVERVGKYEATVEAATEKLIQASEAEFAEQRNFLIGFALVAMVLAVLCGFSITRSVMRALGAEPAALSEAARKVAEGDLSGIPGAAAVSPHSVLGSLSTMQQNLSNIVTKVRSSADSISTGTTEIAMGNADLSQRTEEQASALEETAATMEEFTSTIRNNAENPKAADHHAIDASKVATQGGEVMRQVVDTMKDIHESSRKISDIIGVIDSIAFQTNILALNAAVEAARAGDQGRGFAVVATEVRNLAQRSAGAAKEIKALINESVDKVSTGTQLVDQAGQTMASVVGAIQRVTEVVGQISSASAEQSSGIAQIGQAVSQLDQTTQQNAALVEESAAAAQSLEAQAKELIEAVRVFKLDEGRAWGQSAPGLGNARRLALPAA